MFPVHLIQFVKNQMCTLYAVASINSGNYFIRQCKVLSFNPGDRSPRGTGNPLRKILRQPTAGCVKALLREEVMWGVNFGQDFVGRVMRQGSRLRITLLSLSLST